MSGRFVKGDPRINRRGRPLGRTLSEILREVLNEEAVDRGGRLTGKTIKEMLARRAVRAAAEGDFRFFKEILDRTEGRAPEVDPLISENETAPLDDAAVEAMNDLLRSADD